MSKFKDLEKKFYLSKECTEIFVNKVIDKQTSDGSRITYTRLFEELKKMKLCPKGKIMFDRLSMDIIRRFLKLENVKYPKEVALILATWIVKDNKTRIEAIERQVSNNGDSTSGSLDPLNWFASVSSQFEKVKDWK